MDDNLTEWRVHKVMDQLVATLELNSKNIFATEVSADMLLRLSAVEQVRRWFALESSANKLKWLENWLEKKCAGTMPEEGLMSKASASIKTPKHPSLASNRRLEAVSVNSCSSSPAMLARLRRLQRDIDHKDNELGVSFYDSDDEPASLVGRRIEVKWAQNRYFTGTVGAYVEALDEMEAEPARQKIPTDPEENVPTLNPGQHRVDYDDGDVKSTYLQLRHWKFASS